MGWQYSPYTVVLLPVATVLFGLAAYAWRKRSVSGARELGAILAMVGLWCGVYAVELASSDLHSELLYARLEYIGIASIPLLWLVFVLTYTGRTAWLTWPRLGALAIVPMIAVLLVWTNDYHALFYAHVGQSDHGGVWYLDVTHGPGFWFYTLYSYSLLVAATWMMISFIARQPRIYRMQAAAILAGTFAPWAANAVFLAGLSPFPYLDLTPLGFAVLGLTVAYGIIGFRLLDLAPIARDKVLEVLADGVIVLDEKARIVDLNRAAEVIVGLPVGEVIGRTFAQVATGHRQDLAWGLDLREGRSEVMVDRGGTRKYFDRRLSSYPIPGGGAGILIVLRDISERKLAGEAMEKAYRDLGIKAEKGVHDLTVATETLFAEILQRQTAEKALRESERRLVNFLDSLPLGVFVVDSSGGPLYENRAFQQLAGRSLKDLPANERGESPSQMLRAYIAGTAQAFPVERDPLGRALAGEGSSVNDMELRPSESRALPVEVTGAPIYNEKGEVQYALAVYRDITDRRRAEQNERAYYRNLEFLSRSAIGFMGLPPEGDIYGSIAADLSGLVEGSCAILAQYDPARDELTVRALTGFDERRKAAGEILGGQSFRLDADRVGGLRSGRITLVDGGVPALMAGYLPKEVAEGLERALDVGAVYSIGLATNENLFGAAFLLTPRGTAAGNLDVIQTFVNQCSIALQRWRAEEQVRRSLNEKNVLLSEVHHRVKNNLQMVSSLLSLQAHGAKGAGQADVLAVAQNRIRSLALIHERLYASGDMTVLDMADYLGKLVGRLASTYDISASRVKIRTDIENVRMSIDTAIPCGLIVNELVTNSLKHAFPGGRTGRITAGLLKAGDGEYALSVEDDGVGFPDGLDPARTDTLGCRLITNLAEQLGGSVELDRRGGTKFTVRFREQVYKARG
jgi:PAS domain S-box-containing protein